MMEGKRTDSIALVHSPRWWRRRPDLASTAFSILDVCGRNLRLFFKNLGTWAVKSEE
jgi:hypothetical protein